MTPKILTTFICLSLSILILKAQVPEAPETASFISTSMKDQVEVDPSDNIELIEAPVASQRGNAQLSFPIKLPKGRNGIEPHLEIRYDSDYGNGWLGLGWDLDIPAVKIDTRWGVPRFSASQETETYLFEGSQLGPVSHRDALVSRTDDKQFHPRIEEGFSEIIRHGNHPNNYWWEVTDKDGIKRFFGGLPGLGVDNFSVLKDGKGNIAHWCLTQVQDLNGNYMSYQHEIVQDPGVPGGVVPGYQIYPRIITYTGHESEPGMFEITFIRDRQLSESKRKDIGISGNLGFKEVTADLLRKIEVRYQGNMVRSYDLKYHEGAFFKTLLESISEIDRNGDIFYKHEMEYYDDVREGNTYKPFSGEESWTVPSDNLTGSILFANPLFPNTTSVLGSSGTSEFSVNGAATVGLIGDPFTLTNTLGPNFSYGEGGGKGLIALVDINGDGLPDKVYKKDNELFFRANEYAATGETTFGPKKKILGSLTDFSISKCKNVSIGAEAHPGPVFLGYNYTETTTTVSTFFSDWNGDGLVDIAHNGKVYFNHLNEEGCPNFTTNSGDTPNPIINGEPIDPDLIEQDPNELQKNIEMFPLHDVVRMWQAPYFGVVKIEGNVSLVEDLSSAGQAYSKGDGVRIAIQKNGTELWNQEIDGDDFSDYVPNNVGNIQVFKGDRIYFRVQSKFDGAYDQVFWDPAISYLNFEIDEKDANEKNKHRFQASEDFLLASCQQVTFPSAGTLKIQGDFSKDLTSDDIVVQIIRIRDSVESFIYKMPISWDSTFTGAIEVEGVQVDSNDRVFFRVFAETNVEWSNITWTPQMYYTSLDDGSTVQDQEGNPLFIFCPAPDYFMYNDPKIKTPVYVSQDSGTLNLSLNLVTNESDTSDGDFILTVKGLQELIKKETITLVDGVPVNLPPCQVSVSAGDTIFIEIHCADRNLANTISSVEIVSELNNVQDTLQVGFWIPIDGANLIFGNLYRGWGQFTYNGNQGRANQPINESELKVTEIEVDTEGLDTLSNPDAINIDYDYTKEPFIFMMSDTKSKSWKGADDLTYLKSNIASSSRLGQDDILVETFTSVGTGFPAPRIISNIKMNSTALGAGFGPASVSGGIAWANTDNSIDVFDFNGDSYPDIVTKKDIQFTNQLGGLTAGRTAHGFSGSHFAQSFASGVGTGGQFIESSAATSGNASIPYVSRNTRGGKKSKSTRRGGTRSKNQKTKANSAKSKTSKSAKKADDGEDASEASVGLALNVGWDRDSIEYTWLDINGDGLADRTHRDGRVALNLGYSFTPLEQWNFKGIRGGGNMDIGAGGGVNFFNGSTMFGYSLARSEFTTDLGMLDVNGDGLADQIVSNDPVRVRLNTGNGFASAIEWVGADVFESGTSTGESLNTAATFCVLIPFFGIKICANPGGSKGLGVSRQEKEMVDIDGDGFLDYVQSKKDGELKVKRSTIAGTNLLKRVKRPLGGMIDLTYNIKGNTYGLPSATWVLASVTVSDGVFSDGADLMKVRYEYEGGIYDRREREFFGFAKVSSHELDTENSDAVYRSTVEEYENDNYYTKGFLKREYLADADGKKYNEDIYSYILKDRDTGTELPPAFRFSDNGCAYPALAKHRRLFYEGQENAGLQTTITYTYDNWGNTTSITDAGDGNLSDKLITTIEYHDFPEIYLKSEASSVVVSSDSEILRMTECDVNGRGLVTQVRQFLTGNETGIFDIEYDVYGNPLKITEPENSNGQRMYHDYVYDTETNIYPVRIEDAYGYASEQEFDPAFDKLIQTKDINGHESIFQLDAKGRIESITGPYEIESGQQYSVRFEYFPDAAVPYATAYVFDPEHESDIIQYSFVDGLGRKIQTKEPAFISNGNGQGTLQYVVSGTDIYDAFGRIIQSHYPSTEGFGNNNAFKATSDAITPIKFEYDILDRHTAVVLPDGARSETIYSIENDVNNIAHRVSTTMDALQNVKATYMDVRDRKKALRVDGPDGPIWTTFEFNAISELIAAYDHDGNASEYFYDQFGRREASIHPDGGMTTFKYDLADNLLSEVNQNIRDVIPNGGAIRYTYDFNRLIQINYPKNVQNRVQLHYGEPGAEYNRAGKVWLQEDATGGEENFFGPLGEKIKTIRTVLINQANVETYVSEYQYDTWDRVQQMNYPDGEVVEYNYNTAGQLSSINSEKLGVKYTLVDDLGYDKFDQRVFMKYGNGTINKYSFEEIRRRLENCSMIHPEGQNLYSTNYSYDLADNIVSVKNDATPPDGQLGGTTDYQYSYDEIHRISSATGKFTGQEIEETFNSSYAYDNLHNLRNKQREHLKNGQRVADSSFDFIYQYESEKPHAPSTVAGRSFIYDANGNLKATTSRTTFSFSSLLWDEENRLMGMSDNGYITQYSYDGLGERIIKSHGGIQGVFVDGAPAGSIDHRSNYKADVSPFFSKYDDRFVKHYYIDGERILSKRGTGNFNNKFWPNRGLTAGNLNYVLRQQLIAQSQNIYFGQLGIPPGPPTLPGYYAQPEQTGNPLPGASNTAYSNPPFNWPQPSAIDTSGPPGPPIQFGDTLTLDNVRAGYGFDGVGVFAEESEQYYFHADPLQNTSYVTDYNGNVRQHIEYFPFGDIFVKENRTAQELNYLFNGKEYDEEAGLYYYGARYYDPKFSIWASIDPKAEEFPEWSPYNFGMQNPLKYNDPDGQAPQRFKSADAAAIAFAKKYNPKSIQQNREYGARIRVHQSKKGTLYYTYHSVKKGSNDGLNMGAQGGNDVADIHTHGAWSPFYSSHAYSDTDLMAYMNESSIGYLATPEGRLLKVNPFTADLKVVSKDIPHDGLVYGPEHASPSETKSAFRKAQINITESGDSIKERYGRNPKVPKKKKKGFWGSSDKETKRWAVKYD